MQKIKKQIPLAQIAYEEIKKGLVEGSIPMQATLTERYFTDRLGVSRTPVRSALQQLIQEGLLSQNENGAISVFSIDEKNLFEIAQMRGALEIGAYSILDINHYAHLVNVLKPCWEKMEAASTVQDFQAFNYQDDLFHRCIFTFLENSVLEQTWIALSTKLSVIRQHTQKTAQSTQKSQSEHAKIIKALEEKELERLINLLKSHAFNQYMFLYND